MDTISGSVFRSSSRASISNIESRHLYVDVLTMEMVKREQFR
jgi:hypothetical protein